jgi:ankyrin repeat protein
MLSVRNQSDWTALRVLDLVRLAHRFPEGDLAHPADVHPAGVLPSVNAVTEDNPYIAKATRILRRLCWKDIDAPLPDGVSLLSRLDELGCPQLAQYVRDSGADVEMPKRYHVVQSDLNAEKVRDLFISAAARQSASDVWYEDDPVIRRIVAILEKIPAAEINRRMMDGGTLLLHFARAGCAYLAGKAFDHGADLSVRWARPAREEGKTAFDLCLERDEAEVARVLAFSPGSASLAGGAYPFPQGEVLRKKWYAAFRAFVGRGGANPDSVDADGQGVWHYAAESGDAELAEIAGELGADPNAQRADGSSPLHLASIRGDDACIRILLAAGADPSLRNRDRETPLSLAVKHARPEATRALEAALSPAAYYDGAGNTELHFAAANGNLPYARFLLFRGFDAKALNNRRQTAFDFARGSGALQILSVMEGRPPPALDSQSQQVLDILTGIRKFRDGTKLGELAARIIEHMPWNDLSGQLASGDSLLVALVRLGEADLVRLAIARGAVMKGLPLLEIAFAQGSRETARVLLDAGIPVRQQDRERSLLAEALENRWLDISRLLVEKGVGVERLDKRDQNVWHYVAAIPDHDFVRFARGLSCGISRGRSGDGMTPLHIAAACGNLDAVRALIALGADLFAENDDGDTPLALALRSGHGDCFDVILEAKPFEGYTDEEGRTLLHRAITAKNGDLASLLIDRGFHIDDGDVMGETPLMIAVYAGDIELAAVLIDHGANPLARRHDGKRPRDLAIAVRGSSGMLALIERAGDERAGRDAKGGFAK